MQINTNHRIAFCTDFSNNSLLRLNAFLFSVWNFEISLDIIHLVEENEEKSVRKLDELKQILTIQGNQNDEIRYFIFKQNEEELFLKHLNSSRYFGVSIGLKMGLFDSSNVNKLPYGFFETIYTQVVKDILISPPNRPEKINYRIAILLEKENIDNLYLIKKYGDFMRFNYCTLTIVIKSDSETTSLERKEIESRIIEINPGLKYNIQIMNKLRATEFLIEMAEKKLNDLYIIFAEDYFYHYSMKYFKQSINNIFNSPCLKIFITEENKRNYMKNSDKAVIYRVKDS